MDVESIQIERNGGVGWIWLNRPEVHNAFDAQLVAALTIALRSLTEEAEIRAVVLAARGKSFCAGARVQWMQQQGAASAEENVADARKLAALFHALAKCPKPTIARVQGAALGGGVGLVAACDVAISASTATFATSEVRLGLIPSIISPYVVRAVGERQARRLFLTAERINAAHAERIGLLHMVAEPDALDERVEEILEAILAGAPEAQAEAKRLVDAVANQPVTAALVEDTVQRIARRRADPEAGEGLAAFLEKRSPAWKVKL